MQASGKSDSQEFTTRSLHVTDKSHSPEQEMARPFDRRLLRPTHLVRNQRQPSPPGGLRWHLGETEGSDGPSCCGQGTAPAHLDLCLIQFAADVSHWVYTGLRGSHLIPDSAGS